MTQNGAVTIIRIFAAPVAQLDRVSGYEPEGRAFESLRVRQKPFRAHRLAVRTSPFHGGNRGSIPRGRASLEKKPASDCRLFRIVSKQSGGRFADAAAAAAVPKPATGVLPFARQVFRLPAARPAGSLKIYVAERAACGSRESLISLPITRHRRAQ